MGGLWALSEDRTFDSESPSISCPPRLRTNLSRFTCSFSDLPWRTTSNNTQCRLFPEAHEVEIYLQDYAASLSEDIFRFNTQVTRVEHISQPDRPPWKLFVLRNGEKEACEDFDFVIVASGFFARPWIPRPFLPFTTRSDPKMGNHAVFHSSEYTFDRFLSGIRSDAKHIPKVVVIGGSLSAVEIISDICININSTRPQASVQRGLADARTKMCEIIHVSPRPFWVLPRFLPQRKAPADTSPPKFLPLDLIFYDVSKRRDLDPGSSGAPPSEAERYYQANTRVGTLLGYTSHAQADLSPNLEITEENGWMSSSPWVTISDTYANFVREKKAEIVIGRVSGADVSKDGRINLTFSPNSSVETIAQVDAVICCTGYVPCLDEFLSPEILRAMEYTTASPNSDVTFLPAILPQQMFLTGLPHMATTTMGFVGMYKGPYFGVIELQARYLAALFAGELEWPKQETLSQEAETIRLIRRSREISQFSEGGSKERKQRYLGDYVAVMNGLAKELGILEGTPFSTNDSSASSSKGETDPIIPAHFPDPNSKQDALKSVHALTKALDSSFLSIAVYRALHGTWKVHREIVSYLPDVSGGIFEGIATFLPRRDERNNLYSYDDDTDRAISDAYYEYEYLYSESGTFTLSNNPEMKLEAQKSYIYRYEEDRQVVSVWFVKGGWTADNLFHEISDFDGIASTTSPASARASGSRHLCGPDTYNTSYLFSFLNSGPDLERFNIRYQVEGPKKNYISVGSYERADLGMGLP